MDSIIHWIELHQLPCFYKQMLGISCPACGLQRCIILLLQGKLCAAIFRFPPLVAWAISIVIFFTCKISKIKKRIVIAALLWGNLIVLFMNAIYQNLQK